MGWGGRVAGLLGLMVADIVLVIALTIPVVALGLLVGVEFSSGPFGILLFAAGLGTMPTPKGRDR